MLTNAGKSARVYAVDADAETAPNILAVIGPVGLDACLSKSIT